jgi:hypothetical protein
METTVMWGVCPGMGPISMMLVHGEQLVMGKELQGGAQSVWEVIPRGSSIFLFSWSPDLSSLVVTRPCKVNFWNPFSPDGSKNGHVVQGGFNNLFPMITLINYFLVQIKMVPIVFYLLLEKKKGNTQGNLEF